MKKGWQTKQLGDLCQMIGGGTPAEKKAAYYTGNIPWATVRDMRSEVIWETECKITKEAVKNSSTNIIPAGNVVIATRVGLGKVCLPGQDTAINQDLRGIVPNKANQLSVRFLFWWLKSIAGSIVAEGTGATVQGVKLPFVKSLLIPLPPLPEQKRIVGILDEAFAGIAAAKATAEQNLQNARALFESHLNAVFTQKGTGWVEKKLGDICQIKTGRKDVNQGNPKGTYPFFTCAAKHTFSDTYFFDTEALLVAGNGDVGKVSYFSRKFEVYQRTYVLFEFTGISAKHLYHVLDKRLSAEVSKQKLGNTMPYIKIGMLANFPVPIAPKIEQQRITNELDALSAETTRLAAHYAKKLAALEELKKSLLHQAFAGEL